MGYVPHHERVAREKAEMRHVDAANIEKQKLLSHRVTGLLGRLSIPTSRKVYVEVLRPANALERRFNSGELIYRQMPTGRGTGKIAYHWKVGEMTPGLVLPQANVYHVDQFVGDMRSPSGTERRTGDMLLAQDGRIWAADSPVAPSTYQVIGANALRHEQLNAETLEQMVQQLDG